MATTQNVGLDDDDRKRAEARSIDNDGATVAHYPATGRLRVTDEQPTTIGSVLSGVCRRDAAAAVLEAIGIGDGDAATDEQLRRSRSRARPGLRGKARAWWIVTGEDSTQQATRARRARELAGTSTSRPRAAASDRPLSALAAALQVLKGRRKPMTCQEIYDAGIAQGLFVNLKGATPVATLSAKLAGANKPGGPVERPEPGRYQLRREGN